MPFVSAHPTSVLIVEHDDGQRQTLHDTMKQEGFETASCATAAEALALMRERKFTVAIIDYLPNKVGSQMISQITAANPTIRCIVHTDDHSFESARDAVNFGAFAYVEKLSDPQQLVKHVYLAVGDHSSQQMRESQSRLLWMVQQMPAILWSTDMDLRLTSCTGAGLNGLDVAAEDVVGRTLMDIFADSDNDSGPVAMHQRALAGDAADYESNWNGHTFQVHVEPWLDESGRIIGSIGMGLDVTKRAQAEKQRTLLEAELRQAQKLESIGTLAGGVAHDFNNLLTAIMGYTELARRELSEEHPAIRSLAQVEEAARQAEAVTRSLLTFTRKSQTHMESTDLKVAVRTAVKLMRRMMPASMEIIEAYDDQPLWVEGDATQIQQIVMNLTVNARDAMPNGGELHIDVRGYCTPQEQLADGVETDRVCADRWAMLVVRDTGDGMSPEICGKVFEPFFTTKPPDIGTGLGLTVTQSIVAEHGGRIEVESQAGKGTAFQIYLPTGEPVEVARPEAPEAKASTDGRGLILLADDNDYVRTLMSSTLKQAGYDLLETGNGSDAIDLFHQHADQIQLVILDLDLPGHNGLDCAKQIQQERVLPVVLVTGSVDLSADWAQQVNDDQTMHLLLKPFRMDQLLDLVSKTCLTSVSR